MVIQWIQRMICGKKTSQECAMEIFYLEAGKLPVCATMWIQLACAKGLFAMRSGSHINLVKRLRIDFVLA
jgi:hypothetical protein